MKLEVNKRKKVGKKAKSLLGKGVIPAVVYGPKRKSLNIQLNLNKFKETFSDSGYSKIIDFGVEGDKKESKVLVREVQYEPITDNIIHVAFYELDLKRSVTTEIPIEVKGKSKSVEEKTGFLVVPYESLEVRCLPEKLPDSLEINISNLNEIGDNISVSSLELPDGVELTAEIDEGATLAYIAPPQKEIVEEEKEEVATEGEEAEEAEEGEEGVVGEEEGEGETEEGVEGEEGAKEEKSEEKGEKKGE